MLSAMRRMMTETRYGRMFLVSTRHSGVPRQRDARLYSRSRNMNTMLRTRRAIESQLMAIMEMAMIQKLWPTIRAIRVI